MSANDEAEETGGKKRGLLTGGLGVLLTLGVFAVVLGLAFKLGQKDGSERPPFLAADQNPARVPVQDNAGVANTGLAAYNAMRDSDPATRPALTGGLAISGDAPSANPVVPAVSVATEPAPEVERPSAELIARTVAVGESEALSAISEETVSLDALPPRKTVAGEPTLNLPDAPDRSTEALALAVDAPAPTTVATVTDAQAAGVAAAAVLEQPAAGTAAAGAAEANGPTPRPRPEGEQYAMVAPAPAPVLQPIAVQPPVQPVVAPLAPTAPRVAAVAPSPAYGSAGDYQVQLGAFDSPGGVNQTWARLQAQHPDLLGPLGMEMPQVTSNGKQFFRLRVGPFGSMQVASQVCEILKNRGVNCFATKR